jgi:hypothetical protein
MERTLTNIFLYAFIVGCLGAIAFGAFILYRQYDASEVGKSIFDVSLINNLKKTWVIGGMLASAMGAWTAYWNLKLTGKRELAASLVTICHIIICVLSIIGAYKLIAATEGRFLMRSTYFKLYLYAAVPIGFCTLLGITGVFWKLISGARSAKNTSDGFTTDLE